jgi:hypothetical protein
MPDADRRLREGAQLRKLWRAFQDPRERQEDRRLAGPLLADRARLADVPDPLAAYGRAAVRAAIRYWWSAGECGSIVGLASRLPQAFLDEEPLVRVYTAEAQARLAEGTTRRPDSSP